MDSPRSILKYGSIQGQSSKITRFADRVFWRGHFVGVVSADAEQVDVSFLVLDPSIPSHWLRFAPPERGSRLVCEKRRTKSLGLFRFPLQHVRIFLDTGTGVMAANVKSIEEKAMFVHVGYRLQRALSKEDEEGMVALLTAGTVRRGLFSTSTSNFVIATLHAPR